jgi:hypothetical protein
VLDLSWVDRKCFHSRFQGDFVLEQKGFVFLCTKWKWDKNLEPWKVFVFDQKWNLAVIEVILHEWAKAKKQKSAWKGSIFSLNFIHTTNFETKSKTLVELDTILQKVANDYSLVQLS